MKQENKRCGTCGSFRVYYTKGYCSLFKENNGYCCRHKKVMERWGGCDKWYCHRTPRSMRAKIAVNVIPEIYHKIAVIEQILNEDVELKKMIEETDNID